jgi:DNA-binding PadR family transcriptional regulator
MEVQTMSEADTSPPGTLLISYVLAHSEEPLSVSEIRERVEKRTGGQVSRSTAYRAVRDLRDRGQLSAIVEGDTRRYRLRRQVPL